MANMASSIKTMMQMSKEVAKSAGGIELAKEVPAPIASIVALGGFAAWWVLSSHGSKGPKAMRWKKRIVTPKPRMLAYAKSDKDDQTTPECYEDYSELDQEEEGYVLVDDPESGQTSNSSDPAPSDEEIFEQAKKTIAEAQQGRRQRAGQSKEDKKKEDFFNAIMQGDLEYVNAAFNQGSSAWSELNTESCDEYGNTLLILATQVIMMRAVANATQQMNRISDSKHLVK
jgi:hypothetical protein